MLLHHSGLCDRRAVCVVCECFRGGTELLLLPPPLLPRPSSLKTSEIVCVCVSLGSPPARPPAARARAGQTQAEKWKHFLMNHWKSRCFFCLPRLFLIQLLLSGNIAASLLAALAHCSRSLHAVSKKRGAAFLCGSASAAVSPFVHLAHICQRRSWPTLVFYFQLVYKNTFLMCQR